ncbi:uncharacterized protein C4orf3 homolog [Sorex araneus]|uniref:uncharacterized protein C4orf3 homolog n=1 Tax=Sorex araneus TaxID=42254 RepID=UPI0024338A24|nr:uncharacterized protein C4orf3 homolog [Sorex araneus]
MQARAAAENGRDAVRERRGAGDAAGGPQQNHDARPRAGAPPCPKHSYWLDLWLFILFDLALFLLVYFLPS